MMSGQIDIATLSKLLGHKSLKQTMKYAPLAPAHLKKAAHVMDEVYSLPNGTKLAQSAPQEVEKELSNVALVLLAIYSILIAIIFLHLVAVRLGFIRNADGSKPR